MKGKIYVLVSIIVLGAIFAALAGAISSAIVACLTLAPDIFGIFLGLLFGGLIGSIGGGILGAVVGCIAGVITILLDTKTESKASYKLCMIAVCTLLSAFLVFNQAQEFFDLQKLIDRDIIFTLTILGTLSGLIISFIVANYYRKIILWSPGHAPTA